MKYADRVVETTVTVGTGSYSLVAPIEGFRSFVTGAGDGEQVTYLITANPPGAEFELGVGTVTAGSPDTLTRDSITLSSNAGAAVDWAAGEKAISLTLDVAGIDAKADQVDLDTLEAVVIEGLGNLATDIAANTNAIANVSINYDFLLNHDLDLTGDTAGPGEADPEIVIDLATGFGTYDLDS